MMGPTTRPLLEAIAAGEDTHTIGRVGTSTRKLTSFGATNGAAMRIAPAGLVYPGDPEGAVRLAWVTARPTHDTQIAAAGAGAIAAGVAQALERRRRCLLGHPGVPVGRSLRGGARRTRRPARRGAERDAPHRDRHRGSVASQRSGRRAAPHRSERRQFGHDGRVGTGGGRHLRRRRRRSLWRPSSAARTSATIRTRSRRWPGRSPARCAASPRSPGPVRDREVRQQRGHRGDRRRG